MFDQSPTKNIKVTIKRYIRRNNLIIHRAIIKKKPDLNIRDEILDDNISKINKNIFRVII